LRLLIEKEPDLAVAAEASDAKTALQEALACAPDVILMDIDLPNENGIEATRKILSALPATKIINLTVHSDPALVTEALQAGAVGYILKEDASLEVVRAIRSVMDGKIFLCPDITTSVIRNIVLNPSSKIKLEKPKLSERELQVLKLVAQGLRNKDIADHLAINVSSVETYRIRLMKKLGYTSVAELALYAAREKIISN
jgi:two-component system NarL family response regulator